MKLDTYQRKVGFYFISWITI